MRAIADVSADANPATGLAVYDTYGEGGWWCSAAPALALAGDRLDYALAGTPASGTYPSSYPYAHPGRPGGAQRRHLGSDGNCGPTFLCTPNPAGTAPLAWAHPTVSQDIHLYFSDRVGHRHGHRPPPPGSRSPGRTVSVPHLQVTTGSNGSYTYSPGLPGSYQMTVSDYGYQPQTQTVTVTAGPRPLPTTSSSPAPRTRPSPARSPQAPVTAWPLYAQVSWSDGDGHSGTVYTTPSTGQYSLSLLASGSFYTLTVTPLHPGYTTPAPRRPSPSAPAT